MSDINIDMMNFKQLKNEVQELRDTVTRMKRMYEDILYNLDDDNFSSRFVKEKNGMKTEIKITAEEISSVVSDVSGLDTRITQTARDITSVAKNVEGMSSTVTETASAITTLVTTVGGTQSTIKQTAGLISSIVSGDGSQSIFKQTNNGFLLDGSQVIITGQILFSDDGETFRLFRSGSQGLHQFIMRGYDSSNPPNSIPLVLGDTDNVYIGGYGTTQIVATRGWVENNSVARFG